MKPKAWPVHLYFYATFLMQANIVIQKRDMDQ